MRRMVMKLLLETLLISVLMGALCITPRFFKRIRDYSQTLLLIGTGALLGIYFFDLLPDVVEIGGRSSLVIIIAVWAIYSLGHTFHLHHHEHEVTCESPDSSEAAPSVPVGFLMISMITHCLASGMFLSLSHGLSSSIESTVFWALLAHKGYEALSVSMVLQEKVRNPHKLNFLTALYALSFPAGVALTSLATTLLAGNYQDWIRGAAILVASISAGSLMGCMVHDFVIPSLRQIRKRRLELGWVALGLLGTLLITTVL